MANRSTVFRFRLTVEERRALAAAASAAGLKPSAYVRSRLGLELSDPAGDVDHENVVDVPSPTPASPTPIAVAQPVAEPSSGSDVQVDTAKAAQDSEYREWLWRRGLL